MSAADYVEPAIELLGGERTEFYLTGVTRDGRAVVSLTCCYDDCKWGMTIGQMELWEFVADARDHWEQEHKEGA
jgi:hypothetical protein